MSPAPGWITTAPGVLEMENNWADPAHRLYTGTVVGDSWNGVQELGYLRDLGNKLQEVVAVRLPENKLTFQARIPGGFNANCSTRIRAVGQGAALQHAWHSVTEFADFSLITVDRPSKPTPDIVLTSDSALSPDQYAVTNSLAAFAVGARIDVLWLDDKKLEVGAWKIAQPWGTVDLQTAAWGEMVFFDLSKPDAATTLRSASWVWQPIQGARPFLELTGTGAGEVGSVCGAATDGSAFVWTQYSGWNGTKWDNIDIMTAAYTANLDTLAPKKLRAAPGGSSIGVCLRWKVQAGYAATYEHSANDAKSDYRSYLVRLSDGVMWEIPARPGRRFGIPSYITETEMALEEGIVLPSDAGVVGNESWSIVRYPLSLLGPGIPP